uniref:Uncharacterized protein n=1 Tax=Daphnia galeata TaxID=27404 RepID=A0A8J2WD24_9CRUS|nr:unnamed protein product [Daphnia galeata]
MSVFEQLRPFVSLCQACGVFPFTIEEDFTSKKFVRFNFSFRNLTTWWFMLLFVLQLVITVGLVYLSTSQMEDLSIDSNLPITMAVVFGVNWASSISPIFISHWIVLHYRQLRRAVEIIQDVESLFGEKFIAQHKSSVMKRFIIGFILVIATATGWIMMFAPVFQSMFPPDMLQNATITAALFSITMLIIVMFDCTFFLAHLCYYIIAHYIKLLLPYSDFGVGDKDLVTSSKGFIHTNVVLEKYISAFTFLFFTGWIRILIFLSAADLPINQVRIFREHIITSMSCAEEIQAEAKKITAMTTLMQIDEERLRLSAAGLFKVGMFLIPAVSIFYYFKTLKFISTHKM